MSQISTSSRVGSPTGSGLAQSPSGPAGSALATGAPSGPLTASDRGVTANSVLVGFAKLSLGGVNQAGIVANLRTDMDQVIQAYVDDANSHGGILGRKVVPDIKTVDVIDSNDQQAKCVAFTQTDKVFTILDTGWFEYPSARACITVDNKTPLITGNPGGSGEVQRADGYIIGTAKDDDRKVKDATFSAKSQGFFSRAHGFTKLGIIDDGCEPPVTTTLKADLRQVGIDSWDEFTFSCTYQDQQSEVAQAVLQMHADGVSSILVATNIKTVEAFMVGAQGQGYKPQYFLSDFGNITQPYNATPDQLPAGEANGALGVSEWNQGNVQAQPAVQACSRILVAHGLPPITNWLKDFEAISLCDDFNLFLRSARNAGPTLTRTALVQAAEVSGRFQFGMVHESDYARSGKATGGDLIASVQLDSNGCGCFRLTSAFAPGYG